MDYQALMKAVKAQSRGHNKDLGIEITEIREGYAKGVMPVLERQLNPYGAVHGGVLFAMADTMGGVAALTNGFVIVTSTGTINFLRDTGRSRTITGIATSVKNGRSLSIYNVDLYDEFERHVAQATMTYYSMGKPISEYWDVEKN